MTINQRRPRRTNLEIEKDILEATRIEIEKRGFGGLTVIGIAERAGIEPSVFYKRYKDLHHLLERYIQEYDYWYSTLFSSFDSVLPCDYVSYMKEVFTSMILFFSKDKSLQELILWELTEDNDITRTSNQMREENTKHLVETLQQHFTEKGIQTDFKVFSSIILSSIYFLVSHKGKATFCGIDFSDSEGQSLLADTINNMIERLFVYKDSKQEMLCVAERMKANGIAVEVIADCTGLPVSFLSQKDRANS